VTRNNDGLALCAIAAKRHQDLTVARVVVMRAADVVFFKGILEAHDGVAQVSGERGGELVLTAPASRARELDAIIDDLCGELGAVIR
jgi:Domain of unknown function (DUF4911)